MEQVEEFTPPNHGKSIIEQIWDLLDETVAKIKNSKPEDVANWSDLKGRAGGLADALVLMTGPWFTDSRAIAREAGKRYKIAQGEIPFEQTPGYHYNPAPPGTKYPTSKIIKSAVQSKSKQKVETVLTADLATKIKAALQAGMPEAALAHAYKVTVQQVLSCK